MAGAGLGKEVIELAFKPVPEPVKRRLSDAGMGVLNVAIKVAPAYKKAEGFVNLTALESNLYQPVDLSRVPPSMRAEWEARNRKAELLKEMKLTPKQKIDFSDSHWTWVSDPTLEAQALQEVADGADPLEVAQKHRNDVAEFAGELIFDPLNFAGLVTKPIAQTARKGVQAAKKLGPVAKLFELPKSVLANVAWHDINDVTKAVLSGIDDAPEAAKVLDDFVKNPAKYSDKLTARGVTQAESVAEFMKGANIKGKKAVGDVLDLNKTANVVADAGYSAARKALGLAAGGDKNLYNNATRFLAEHWLGTRFGWTVFNVADNSVKLAIEGVNPAQRIGHVTDAVKANYGAGFIPSEIQKGTLATSVMGDGKLLHEKLFGPLAKPMAWNFKISSAFEQGANMRVFLNKSIGKITGLRDTYVGTIFPDIMGPVPDDIQRLVSRKILALEYPTPKSIGEIFDYSLKRNASVFSPITDEAIGLADEVRNPLVEKIYAAKGDVGKIERAFVEAGEAADDVAKKWLDDVGGPNSPTPFTKYEEIGDTQVLFEENGWQYMPFRPDLDHEAVGALANKVGLQAEGKHFQRRISKIAKELGEEAKSWSQFSDEGKRLNWNAMINDADAKNIELPAWFERIELVDPADDIAWVSQKLAAAQEAGDAEQVAALERQLAAATRRAEAVPPAAPPPTAPPVAVAPEAARAAEEAPGITQRLAREEAGAYNPGAIAQSTKDQLGQWKAAILGDINRVDETVEMTPEAMSALRKARDATMRAAKLWASESQIFGLDEAHRILGDYLRQGNLVKLGGELIPFFRFATYNLPYWAWTFAEKPGIPAFVGKTRAFQVMKSREEGLPARLWNSFKVPGSRKVSQSLGLGDADWYVDPWRMSSFLQTMPGGTTPYQQRRHITEVIENNSSVESAMAIGTQMGVRGWPWFEYVMGYKGMMGDDWYPYDLSSFEPLARALFDTDTTPSSLLREQLGLEPNKFLEWQTQKEVRGQIMRGEEADWEEAKKTARLKTAVFALIGMTTGLYPKEFTDEEAERMGISSELQAAVKADVVRTGGDPTTMDYQQQWSWIKRRGATMKGDPSATNKFYEANPDYPDLPWESEEEWKVGQDLTASFEEKDTARAERDERIADLAIPHDKTALSLIYDDYYNDVTAIDERYPNANITPSSDRPMEVLKDRASQALLRQLDETRPDYYDDEGEVAYENYEDYAADVREWEAGLRDRAMKLWGPEVFIRNQYLASPEALEEYDKSHHTIARAANYTWGKHIESPFWEEAQWAQVSQLAGETDWGNVTERISQWSDLIETTAEPVEIDPRIVAAMIDVESGGNPEAYNSRSQATGLMQVIPGEVFEGRPSSDELLDPKTNIEAGIDILVEYLIGTDYDLKDALYEYSGGSAWSSKEAYEKQYWDRLSAKFKGLWGVSLGSLRADARDTVMARPMDMDVDSLMPLIMMEYPGRWTPDEIRAELRGKDIMGVLEAQQVQRPETAAAREVSTDVWDTRSALPPGVYRKAIDALPEVEAFLSAGENPKAALEAIEVYTDEHPVTGTPQEWAQAEREHDEFRRWVYNQPGLGASIYEEQNAYFAAREEGRRVEPSERLQSYWDAHDQFRQGHPLYTRFYFPDWQPREGGGGGGGRGGGGRAGAGRARAPTQAEQREAQAATWTEFAASFTGGAGLLELIQSWLLLTPSQREWFLRGNPELQEWLMAQDPEWLGQLAASLGAAQPVQRGGGGFQWRPDQPRWYRSWS